MLVLVVSANIVAIETPPVSRIRTLKSWNIRIDSKELDLSTVFSDSTLLMLYGPVVDNTLFVAKDCEPFSLSLARQKIKEWGGITKSLKINKAQGFLSYITKVQKGKSKDSLIWVATNGDCLIANTDRLTKKIYRSLINRVSRSVKQ